MYLYFPDTPRTNNITCSKILAAFLKGRVPVENRSRKLRWMKLDRPLFWVQSYQQDKLSCNEAWHTNRQHTKRCKAVETYKYQLLQRVRAQDKEVSGAFSYIVLSDLDDRCVCCKNYIYWGSHFPSVGISVMLEFGWESDLLATTVGEEWLFCVLWEQTATGPSYFTERSATCVAYVDVFDEVLMPIFQEGHSDGISYCPSSMEYLCIFTSLVGRDLNRKPAHKLLATDGPDTALTRPCHLNGRHDCTRWPHSNWFAEMVPLAVLELIGRLSPTTWPYTTWLADMTL